jgi:radical SAM superfamily enzyme YgiQ (UPF0313 family)
MAKWALIHSGNDIVYGLTFFAGELRRASQEIYWYDGEQDIVELASQIAGYRPDYICFGPLSSEFIRAIEISREVKRLVPSVKTVFGGHHVKAVPEELDKYQEIDYLVWGPCYEVVDKILGSPPNTQINGVPTAPKNMQPALSEYYSQVQRIGQRERKYLMSHFGCIYNCSYCCTDITRKAFGGKKYKEFWLNRRPVDNLIEEARVLQDFDTKEIGLADDDALYDTQPGGEGTDWLAEFAYKWKLHIDLPMYANVTPKTVGKAEDDAISALAGLMDTIQMGFETSDEGSRKVFNRKFQDEKQVINACKRLATFGLKTKLETIIGLPNIDGLVPDPVEDAIHTIQTCQRVSQAVPGMIKAQCYPLILFPGTALWKDTEKAGIPTRDAWKGTFYEGIGSIIFDEITENRLKNLVKMTTMFVKYNISEEWMRALIDMNMTESARRQLSEAQYLDSLTFRLGESAKADFSDIVQKMAFKY